MKQKRANFKSILVWAALSLCLTGCGGSKVLQEPEPLVVTESIASASDQRLSAILYWVIVRDGPGTWARNADWDEYLLRVHNLSDDAIYVSEITVSDSLDTRIKACRDRKQCVKGAKEAKRRYKDEGLQVKAGAGAGTLVAAGAITGATTMAAVYTVGPLGISQAGAVAATGGLLLAPVLAVGGIMRGVNNSKVNAEIELRHTPLPVVLREEEAKSLDLFVPLTPSPRQVEINYADSLGEHTLVIDTHNALAGLHLQQADN